MASLTGQLVAETYKALLKLIDNDILTASEKQITDGFGGGSNVFIDSQGFLRANKYKVTNGLATQFLKADGSLDSNAYLTSITGAQVITALGYTPVPTTRTITINGETHNLAADNSWTVGGTAAIWGNITGILSNQTDLQNALNAKYNNPTGTISQYIRGDGTLATFPTMPGGLPTGGSAGQILSKIDATDYNAQWIDNYATQTKNEVKLGQTLAKGAAVYVSSANGTNIIVSAASNASESLSSKTFGLLETGGVTNDLVKCVTFGLLAGLDTSTATAGDPVWLGVNGALLFGVANKPVAPANMVYIGVVTRVQSNNGEIFVNIQNGFEIEELHDVLIQSKVNNQGLFYESSTGLWKNKSIATVLGYTPANDASVVHNTGDETVNGRKTFTTQQTFNNSFLIKNTGSGSVPYGGWTTIYTSDNTFNVMVGTSASTSKGFSFLYGSTVPLLTLPSADGTLALVDQLSNFVSGSGSVGYIPKWTSASVIGSSLLYDDGTNIGYGTNVLNYGNYGRTFTGAGFGTASFGFESVSNSTTNNALLGGLSFVIGQNDSSRRIGAAIQAYLLASTATNYGSELRFFAKADGVFTIAEVARMTSSGLRVYGTIVKDGGTSSQYLMADGSVSTGPNLSLYLPLTGGTLTGKLTISTSAMGAQINGGTFTQALASSYALGIANGGGFDLTLGTSSTETVIQSWSSKPISLNPQGNNVGIGVTSALWKLSVANEMVVGAQGGSDYLYFSGGSGYGSKAKFFYSNGSLNSELSGNGNTLLNLYTGNVGIGTNNPTDRLQIGNGTADAGLVLYANNGSSGWAGRILGVNASGSIKFQHRNNSATYTDIFEYNANSSVARADFFGYTNFNQVGIGSPNVVEKLNINGNIYAERASSNVSLLLKRINTDTKFEISTQESQTRIRTWKTANDSAIWFDTDNAGTTRMAITGGGNIGFGLTNPQTQFQMNGVLAFSESGFDTVRLHTITHAHSDGNSTNNYIALNISNGSGTTSERMRVNGEGIGLFGTTGVYDYLTRFRVNYALDSCYLDITSGAGDAALRLAGNYGQITNVAGALYISCGGATGDMIFRTGSFTERLRITNTGNIQTNGNAIFAHSGSLTIGGSYQTIFTAVSGAIYLVSVTTTAADGTFGLLTVINDPDKSLGMIYGNNILLQFSGDNVQMRSSNGASYNTSWTATRLK